MNAKSPPRRAQSCRGLNSVKGRLSAIEREMTVSLQRRSKCWRPSLSSLSLSKSRRARRPTSMPLPLQPSQMAPAPASSFVWLRSSATDEPMTSTALLRKGRRRRSRQGSSRGRHDSRRIGRYGQAGGSAVSAQAPRIHSAGWLGSASMDAAPVQREQLTPACGRAWIQPKSNLEALHQCHSNFI